jgi:hypothetical protein
VGVGRGDDLARPGRLLEPAQLPGRVQRVGDRLHRARRRVLGKHLQHHAWHADGGDPPCPDPSLRYQPLERGARRVGEQPPGRAPLATLPLLRDQVAVQEEQVDVVELHAIQALVQRAFELARQLRRGRVADAVLGRDPHPGRQVPAERLADDPLRLAVAVPRRHVEQADARVDRLADGRHRLLAAGRAPQPPEPAATERQGADRPQPPERPRVHRAGPPGPRLLRVTDRGRLAGSVAANRPVTRGPA